MIRTRTRRSFPFVLAVLSLALVALSFNAIMLAPVPAVAASACASGGPTSGAYSVTVCLDGPLNDASVVGDLTVTASVVKSKSSAVVTGLRFFVDGSFVLFDHTASPYGFVLPSIRWIDGVHRLEVEAVVSDGYVSPRAAVSLTFANGVSSPPVNQKTFSPAAGTTPGAGQPFVVAAVGDGADSGTAQRAVTDLIASWNPNMFLYLGDVYDEGTPTEFYNWYSPTWGRFRSITNPTIGNHEYPVNDGFGYFDYWDNIPHYYSFDVAGWHVVTINSTREYGQFESGSPQFRWLTNDLQTHNGPCTIVYFHNPPVRLTTSAIPVNERFADLWKLLADNGVDIVMNGDVHSYERWKPLGADFAANPAGVTEFVVGTGGHQFNNFTTTDSRLASNIEGVYGALRLELNHDGAAFRFVSTQGATLDSGSIPCSQASADVVPPTAPSNLNVTSTSSSTINLSWTAATDNVGVTGYDLFRDGTLLASLGPVTSYSDSTLIQSTTYAYTVKARDAAGNRSVSSNVATVTSATGEATTTFNPDADARVEQANPDTNYGAGTTLRADADAGATVESFLRFTPSGLGGTIQSAILRLWVTDPTGNAPEVYRCADATWGEKALTWNTKPGRVANSVADVGSVEANTWLEYDVTSAISGNTAVCFDVAPQSTDGATFSSRESSTNKPQLVVISGASLPSSTATATATTTPTSTSTTTATATVPTSTSTTTSTPTSPSPTIAVSQPAASSQTFVAVADARVIEANPTSNYGTSLTLATDSGAGNHVESYLRFTVSGLGGSVQSALLHVYVPSGTSTGTRDGPAVYACTDQSCSTWAESGAGGITWASRPPRGTTAFDDKAGLTAATWVDFDVTSLVNGNGTYTFVLAQTSTDGASFASRESASTKPQLVLITSGTNAASTTSATPSTTPSATSVATTVPTSTPSITPTQPPATTVPSGTALTFAPIADASVREVNPGTGYGAGTSLLSDGGSGSSADSYLRFNVSGVGGAINAAFLRLYIPNGSSTGTVDGPAVYSCTDAACATWVERGASGITWQTRPFRGTTAYDDKGALSAGMWVEFDVTPLVSGNGIVTLVVAQSSADGTSFSSRESSSNKPQLVVYTDEAAPSNPVKAPATSTSTARIRATPTMTSAPTLAATATATPTSTSVPTSTPVPADTPTPTVIPTETATSTPLPTPETLKRR